MSWKASAAVKALTQDSNGKKLTPSEKCLLYTLADSYNEDKGYAWPSMARLAGESMLSTRQAIRIVKDLESRGILAVDRRDNNSSIYRFKFSEYVKVEVEIPPDKMSPPHIDPPDTHVTPPLTPMSGGTDIAMSDKPPLTTSEPQKDLFGKNHLSDEEVIKRAFALYHRETDKTRAYGLTDKRMKKGLARFKHAVKKCGGNRIGGMKLMKGAILAISRSPWHTEHSVNSWDKHLFASDEQFEEWIEKAEKQGLIEG